MFEIKDSCVKTWSQSPLNNGAIYRMANSPCRPRASLKSQSPLNNGAIYSISNAARSWFIEYRVSIPSE